MLSHTEPPNISSKQFVSLCEQKKKLAQLLKIFCLVNKRSLLPTRCSEVIMSWFIQAFFLEAFCAYQKPEDFCSIFLQCYKQAHPETLYCIYQHCSFEILTENPTVTDNILKLTEGVLQGSSMRNFLTSRVSWLNVYFQKSFFTLLFFFFQGSKGKWSLDCNFPRIQKENLSNMHEGFFVWSLIWIVCLCLEELKHFQKSNLITWEGN